MSKNYTVTYQHMEVNFGNKGFKIEAKSPEAFQKDAEGWGVLTDFFIELTALKDSQVDELLKKYKITVFSKPE